MKLASDQQRVRDVLVLRRLLDPESGQLREAAFVRENRLYEKALRKKRLDDKLRTCRKCPGLNESGDTECCCGWGDLDAKIMFVGQSLHEPGVRTGVPFILGSGLLIDCALRLCSLARKDVFFTNAVHCHPPGNRASTTKELEACLLHLTAEISIVKPAIILCLGNDAMASVAQIKEADNLPEGTLVVKLKHPAAILRGSPEDNKDWILRCAKQMRRAL